jgi:hypothetical protein
MYIVLLLQEMVYKLDIGDQRYTASPESVERCTEEKLVVHKKHVQQIPHHISLYPLRGSKMSLGVTSQVTFENLNKLYA